jgi:N-methylhydantoinase B
MGALDLGEKRMDALLDEYGAGTVAGARTARPRRAADAGADPGLPDGHWEAEDFLDNDGITDEPLKIALDLEIDGDRMVLDFSAHGAGLRRAGQHRPLHASPPAMSPQAHLPGDVPANAGVLRADRIPRVPRLAAVAEKAPKPVGGYTETILRMIDVIFQAVAKSRPDGRWPAPTARSTRCRSPATGPTGSAG